jgi:hypothetical protein
MNLTDLVANAKSRLTASASTSTNTAGQLSNSASAKLTAAPSPLAKANERIQKQVDSTQAQLSKLGLVKSSVAGLQTQSKQLTSIPADMSAGDVTTVMAKFFNAYNASVATSNAASVVADGTPGAASARKVTTDLRRALTANTEVSAAMKKLGLKIGADGALTQDAKVFADALVKDPSAVRNALKTLGTKIAAAADRELASGGSLDATVSSLNQRGSLLAAQQKAIKAYTF